MCRSLTLLLAGLLLMHCAARPSWAEARTATCKKMRAALAAGETIEQVAAEFDTDVEHVVKCTQTRVHRRAKPKAEKTPRTTKAPKSTSPSARKPEGAVTAPRNPTTPHRSVLGRPHP